MAMSGGIDSSVSAILLLEQGYELVGVTFRAYDSLSTACLEKETGCCNINTLIEAKQMAETLGFEHHILDLRDDFKQTVIQDFIYEYTQGRTPNPCVLCNATIKWGRLLEVAKAMNCDKIATGHYARIGFENNRYFLKKGIDPKKDQSYFLWKLSQECLAQTIFPLGDLTKNEVRNIAKQKGFEKLSKKRESQEICFIPDNDYRQFLRERIPEINDNPGQGNFIDTNGNILGKHKGFPFYTIGQRKGLEIAMGYPVYVTNIDAKTNTITLGKREELLQTTVWIKDVNLMKYEEIKGEMQGNCKIRYNNEGEDCSFIMEGEMIKINFKQPVSAVTPGQSAVIYENNDLVCGGIIAKIN